MTRTEHSAAVTRRALAIGLGGICLVAGGLMPVAAQEWPAKPITLIVPFPPGGGTDAFARPLAAQFDQQLNQRVIIDNRGGAGGTLGAAAAAKANPDGYTFFVGAAHHAIAPAIYPKLEYDLEKDLVPVGLISAPPQVVVISPKAMPGVKTLKDFIDYAKANPGKVNYASAGNGTTHHLAGELFKLVSGLDLAHIPYKGAGPAMQDLVAGHVHVMFDGLGSSAPQINGGAISGLAVASAKRSASIPNVPTALESGVKGYDVATWYAVFAVKGTPPAIIERMKVELKKALATEAIKAAWLKNGSDIPDVMGDDMGKFVKAEITRWGKVVADAKVKIE